jgi:oxygen-independent coproporphyrinogen-3 oxidase
MGVQDFDPAVQKSVNRIQSEEGTLAILQAARDNGFKSVSIDLIYGLPKQNVSTFGDTLDKVISASPDRVAVYNYAHLPHLFKTQRGIKEHELPSADVKLAILALTIQKLTDAGYVYIGMDHFAKPDDELALSQRNGTLHRNFQGYSTHADCDLVGMGLTSIGKVGNSYSQNLKETDAYYQCLDDGKLPIFRGLELDEDDVMRREIISELMCHSVLDFAAIANRYNVDFHDYFREELASLAPFEEDNLVRISQDNIQITPAGRMLLRNIAMQFDAYLKPGGKIAQKATYSRLI